MQALPETNVGLQIRCRGGNRIAHTNALGFREKTYFDSLGRVTQTLSHAGRSTRISYAYLGSILGVGGATVGGFQKTTTDANGRTLIDRQDIFGRLTWHQDLGGRSFVYRYNHAGWLTAQIGSNGQNIAYDYYANGFIKTIRDQAEHTLTSYEYDKQGNKTFEGYVTLHADNATVREYHQQASITYDELNRIKSVTDPRYTLSYEYDAVGNRRRVVSTYHDGVNGNKKTQDYWYRYDSMNRFTLTMGTLSGARATAETDTTVSILRGAAGVELAYDAAGQRRQATKLGEDGLVHTEAYSYTADGYLEDTRIDGILRARRTNDALGRVVTYREYSSAGAVTFSRQSVYDKDNLIASETSSSGGSTTYYRHADGTLEHTSTTHNGSTTSTYYGYEWWDSAKESTITATPYNPSAPGWKSGYSQLVYDVNGHLKEAHDKVGERSLRYVTNAEGLILARDEIVAARVSKSHRFYYLDGKRTGDIGNDGPTRFDYVQSLARSGSGKPDYKNHKPISSADFDQNYEPINASYPGTAASSYTVRSGDTLQKIAAQVWGDSSLWYLIADANGLTGRETLAAGMTLTIPNKVTNIHNNSGTFRVYNAGEAIGDTSPTLPDPPPPPRKGDGCGGMAKIFVVIVAVVATAITAGAATVMLSGGTFAGVGLGQLATIGAYAMSGSLGAVGLAAAAVGGAAGSILSQGTGMAMGIQDKFSWSGVAMSAVGAGIGASGMGAGASSALGVTSRMGQAALTAMAGNTLTQGAAVALGMQKKFDWRGVAVSALGGAAGYGAGQALSGMGELVRGTAMGMVNGGVRSLAGGGKPNWGAIAAESFGNALGNSIVDSMKPAESELTKFRRMEIEAMNADAHVEASMGLGSGLNPYRSSAPGLRVSERDYAHWSARIDEGIRHEAKFVRTPSQEEWAESSVAAAGASIGSLRSSGRELSYSETMDVRDIRLSFGYQSTLSMASARAAKIEATQRQDANGPSFVAWDGVTRGSSAEEYLKSVRGGLDPVRGDNWHFRVAQGLPEAALNEAGGLLVSKTASFVGSKLFGWGDQIAPRATYVDPYDALQIINTPKGLRPLPETYMPQSMIDAHTALFKDGVARIGPSAPTGTIGRTETWVMPKFVAEKAIAEAGGDVAKLERLLGFDNGYLGKSPVLVEIPKPIGVRIPSGREFGANHLWNPGGYTNGGIPEAVINPVPAGGYATTPIKVRR